MINIWNYYIMKLRIGWLGLECYCEDCDACTIEADRGSSAAHSVCEMCAYPLSTMLCTLRACKRVWICIMMWIDAIFFSVFLYCCCLLIFFSIVQDWRFILPLPNIHMFVTILSCLRFIVLTGQVQFYGTLQIPPRFENMYRNASACKLSQVKSLECWWKRC